MKSIALNIQPENSRSEKLRTLLYISALLMAGIPLMFPSFALVVICWGLIGIIVMSVMGMIKLVPDSVEHDYPAWAIFPLSMVWPIVIYLLKNKKL